LARTRHPLPIDLMREFLHYDPETGAITNKVSRRGARKGDPAGQSNGLGYRRIYFQHRYYYHHRVAWAMHYGEQPPDYIDHIDRDGTNNSIANLRKAEQHQNLGNSKRRSDNKTGFKGVHLYARTGKFIARCVNVHLGCFDTAEEASEAYKVAAEKSFGEFARSA
jgi:hypothetical protein